ncbi:MAG: LysM peptidoglycan-binding domain-containing protein [Bacteroidia bacterium]|nr:LysM peptidoglycan-binding domain-containing protein [Bacteroidia bacterium]
MCRNLLFTVVFLLLCHNMLMAQPTIPVSMDYCGIELTFTPGARTQLAEYVKKIHESPRYFNEMIRRADMYMPFIEEAFTNVRVPQDLKYLAIQESALRPDVVSKSNAVGFWQFKQDAAIQYGLRVNEEVDERSHIYRASEAAAMYLAKSNQDFDNWVYAVVAYYEGLTGAVSYTNPDYYSARKMTISEDFHWYVLKAIAHKIAYEEALKLPRNPEIYLYPVSSEGESNYRKILEENGVEEETFLMYNKWIREGRKLPRGEAFTCYIPKSGEFYTGHVTDPNKVPGGGTPVYLASVAKPDADLNSLESLLDKPYADNSSSSKTENTNPPTTRPQPVRDGEPVERPIPTDLRYAALHALPKSELRSSMYVEFPLKSDLHYGLQYVEFDGTLSVEEIANRFMIPLSDMLVWNGLIPGVEPRYGAMLYLDKPSKNEYHIVRKGESLPDIAARHFSSIGKIRKLNRMEKGNLMIYVGQKLYLRNGKPKGEPIIILSDETLEEQPVAETAQQEKPVVKPTFIPVTPPQPEITDIGKTASRDVKPAVETPAASQPPVVQSPPTTQEESVQKVPMKWTYHTVKTGETLWQISQKYGTKVEIIKMVNKLTSDTLAEGKVLRIFAKAELVGK